MTAILIDTNAEYPSLASALTLTSFTAVGWSYVVSDLGATTVQTILCATAAFGTDADVYFNWSNDTPGSTMVIGSYDGTNNNTTGLASRPAAGTWFHWFVKCSGTGANLLIAGWRSLTSGTYVTGTSTLAAGSTGTAALRLGNDGFSDYANARYSAHRLYSTALTEAEILCESFQHVPIKWANLVGWRLLPASSVANAMLDGSANGLNFTANGTMTIVEGPPIPFKRGRRRMALPTADVAPPTVNRRRRVIMSRAA